jgi:rare lipoprotein A
MLGACVDPPSRAPHGKKRGGYYKNDGPGDIPPAEVMAIPDAVPRTEPIHPRLNHPYQAAGKTWVPHTRLKPFRQRGVASWYGKQFHGKRTSSGERYNMYAMTAAHPTLPIPSYARVTALNNGRSVVVRINDRGPFLHGRIIDLSWAAASKLGYVGKGSATVEVEQILPATQPPFQMPEESEQSGDSPELSQEAPQEISGSPSLGVSHATKFTPRMSETTPNVENSTIGITPNGQNLFLQLGVFASRQHAKTLHNRALALPTEVTGEIKQEHQDGLFRIIAGPYASPEEARTAAGRIGEQLGIQPFIVRRNVP